MDCSIICIANNAAIKDGFIADLNSQVGVSYQLFIIDNLTGLYNSAREAYNDFLNKINSELVVFAHPDIRFFENNSLEILVEYANKLGNFGVIGVAGCRAGKKWEIKTNIVHGKGKKNAGTHIDFPIQVQTVDECLFIMKKDVIQSLRFSSIKGWHLYAVEQCLRVQEIGLSCYVVPIKLWHLSDGRSLDPSYMKSLEELIEKYGRGNIYINTTVKQWKTKGLLPYLYRKYYYFKQTIKKLMISEK